MFWTGLIFSVLGLISAIFVGIFLGEERKEKDGLWLFFLVGSIVSCSSTVPLLWVGGAKSAVGKPDTLIESGRVNMVYEVMEVSEIGGKTYASLRDLSDQSWRIYEMKSKPSGPFVKLVKKDGETFFGLMVI